MACSIWPGSASMLPASRAGLQHELDVLADQTPEHLLGVGEDGIHVEHARTHDLAAAECQQLIGERGGPVGGLEDLFGIASQRIERRQLVQHHPVVAGNDGEHVVEVVRHAAREPAHGFHFLGVNQLLFQLLALADIAHKGDREQPLSRLDMAEAHLDGELGAVFATAGQIHADSHGANARPREVLFALPPMRANAWTRGAASRCAIRAVPRGSSRTFPRPCGWPERFCHPDRWR